MDDLYSRLFAANMQAFQKAMAPSIAQQKMAEELIGAWREPLERMRAIFQDPLNRAEKINHEFLRMQEEHNKLASQIVQSLQYQPAYREMLNTLRQMSSVQLIGLADTVSSPAPPIIEGSLDDSDDCLRQIDDNDEKSERTSLKKNYFDVRKFGQRFSNKHVLKSISNVKPVIDRFGVLYLICAVGQILAEHIPQDHFLQSHLLVLISAAIALWQELSAN